MSESRMFQEAFKTNCSGCRRECACGRVHFDVCDRWDWEEGELNELEAKSKESPDKYFPSDGAVSTMLIDGNEFVMDCQCGYASKAEKFIRQNAERIKRYLSAWSKELRQKAESIKPEEVP